MNDNTDIITELRKMNEFLQRIDWKLWNLHKKYYEDGSSEAVPATPPVQNTSAPAKNLDPVMPTAKYPSIESWE